MDRSTKWHSYSGKKAAFVGFVTVIGIALSIFLDSAMVFVGGSISQGWDHGLESLKLFGVLLLPFCLIAGTVATLLCKPFGIRAVLGFGFAIFVALMAYSAYLSLPSIALKRLGKLETIPQMNFTDYQRLASFSDGVTYVWTADCDETKASTLFEALKLNAFHEENEIRSPSAFDEHDLVDIHREYFGEDHTTYGYFTSKNGFVGTYSKGDQRMNLMWSPLLPSQ